MQAHIKPQEVEQYYETTGKELKERQQGVEYRGVGLEHETTGKELKVSRLGLSLGLCEPPPETTGKELKGAEGQGEGQVCNPGGDNWERIESSMFTASSSASLVPRRQLGKN